MQSDNFTLGVSVQRRLLHLAEGGEGGRRATDSFDTTIDDLPGGCPGRDLPDHTPDENLSFLAPQIIRRNSSLASCAFLDTDLSELSQSPSHPFRVALREAVQGLSRARAFVPRTDFCMEKVVLKKAFPRGDTNTRRRFAISRAAATDGREAIQVDSEGAEEDPFLPCGPISSLAV
ncbi:hypothetical protein BKA93DRAFT_492351 [Sparassis latifolia]